MDRKRIKSILGVQEMTNYKTVSQQLFSELLGTFLYLALVLTAGNIYVPGSDTFNIQIVHGNEIMLEALANGLILASVIQVVGHVSGGHINPAVTLAAMICGHIKPLKAICYVVMQVIGCIAGATVAYHISSKEMRHNLGATTPYKYSRAHQTFAFEFLMTFLLISVVLSIMDKHRGARGLGSSPLTIGLCLTGCMVSCLQYSGSLNPARSLGPAVVMNVWDSHWVYWVGPLCGGLVAGLVYRFVLSADRQQYILEQYQGQTSDLQL